HHPSLWIGVNFLGVTGAQAFPMLGTLLAEGCAVDGYWADDACIDEFGQNDEAETIAQAYRDSGWRGLYFGGTCFKKQRAVDPAHYVDAAREACAFMDVVTTSGIATGHAADQNKIATFRRAIGDRPLALASGITPENAASYSDVDCFMVATGINLQDNFYDIDPERLHRLLRITHGLGQGGLT
ncbi:MAG: adenine phosphoribosyltransferase, partial [Pseudomonadota bacterium]